MKLKLQTTIPGIMTISQLISKSQMLYQGTAIHHIFGALDKMIRTVFTVMGMRSRLVRALTGPTLIAIREILENGRISLECPGEVFALKIREVVILQTTGFTR
jgi:hypothetical protein